MTDFVVDMNRINKDMQLHGYYDYDIPLHDDRVIVGEQDDLIIIMEEYALLSINTDA